MTTGRHPAATPGGAAPGGRGPAPGAFRGPSPELWASLEGLYAEYCRAQAREFVRMVPREAIRPLYRRALEWSADGHASDGGGERPEPVTLLEVYCRKVVLPLPPFRVWVRDYLSHREAYLSALDRAPAPACEGRPVDVDLRRVKWNAVQWTATLRIRRHEGGWRGAVAFRSPGREAPAVTAEVFRGSSPQEVRERFHLLEEDTLRAFLRSSHP